MMSEVSDETLQRPKINILLLSICFFYSRVVLKKLESNQTNEFRNVERNYKKVLKLKADISYLEFCSTNQLLPKFTNFRLYDVTAQQTSETRKFRESLLQREILKHRENLIVCQRELTKCIITLYRRLSPLKFYSCLLLVKRLGKQFEADIVFKHRRKLKNLHGSDVYLPQSRTNVINLSKYEPSNEEM